MPVRVLVSESSISISSLICGLSFSKLVIEGSQEIFALVVSTIPPAHLIISSAVWFLGILTQMVLSHWSNFFVKSSFALKITVSSQGQNFSKTGVIFSRTSDFSSIISISLERSSINAIIFLLWSLFLIW